MSSGRAVAVTGASGHVASFVLRRLEELGAEARPLGRRDDPGPAFRDAAAVIHLAGTLQAIRGNTYEEANRETVRRTVAAAQSSAVRRIVLLSYPGSDPASANAYLRAKGEAEELVRSSGREAVILRSTLVVGPPESPGPSATPFLARAGKPVSVLGTGRQRYAPVLVGDVAEALVRAAVDPDAPAGTFSLAGPDVVTVDELVEILNRGSVPVRHLGPRLARVLTRVVPSLTPAMVDVLASESLPDAPAAAEALGLELHGLRDVYAREPVRAAA